MCEQITDNDGLLYGKDQAFCCLHPLSATKRNSSGDAVRDSLVDPNAAEVSAGIPDSYMGQVRDGLDSFVCSRL